MRGPKKNRKPENDDPNSLFKAGGEAARNPAFDDDLSLDRLLDGLPNVPVSSSFTSQVVRMIDAEKGRQTVGARRMFWQRPFFTSVPWHLKLAAASVVLAAGLFSYFQYQMSAREELARSVVAVGSLASLPTDEMLKDFEAIRRLNLVPQEVDIELLAALQ